MRIAFYAPLKPADSPVPSGDRAMARSLVAALELCGHDVFTASRFVSRNGDGDPVQQQRLKDAGRDHADGLIGEFSGLPEDDRPDAWLTYHLYHKAPDWLGPAVSKALDIPYFIAEASHAPKRAGGPWDIGYRAAAAAIADADGIIGLSSLDAQCVLPLLSDPARYHRLKPFTEVAPFAAAADAAAVHRARLDETFGLAPDTPLLLAVGMMRDGDKLASYRVLAEALGRLTDHVWQLLIVGDGPARDNVEHAFASFTDGDAGRIVRFAGAAEAEDLAGFYAAADILVWPAVNEAYGLALLEAQAAGTPVVAGRTGGVPDIVRDGVTGMLTPVGDADAFADAVTGLLDDPDRRATLGDRARHLSAAEHSLSGAARALDKILTDSKEVHAA